jgi:hypothetical protein
MSAIGAQSHTALVVDEVTLLCSAAMHAPEYEAALFAAAKLITQWWSVCTELHLHCAL